MKNFDGEHKEQKNCQGEETVELSFRGRREGFYGGRGVQRALHPQMIGGRGLRPLEKKKNKEK